jgi:formate dehydrogenase subunit delta
MSAPASADAVLDVERILELATDIGNFFAPYPEERAIEGVRNHLRSYWDPRMREALARILSSNEHGLPPHVVAGARLLEQEGGLDPKSYYGPPKA